MNPTPIPPLTQSQTERLAQIAAESASQFLQAGLTGITLFSLITNLALIALIFAILWFLLRRTGTERELNKQILESVSDKYTELASDTKQELKQSNENRIKLFEATHEQTSATNKQTEVLESMNRSLVTNQSMLGDTLDRVDMNVLRVVNGFGALDENIRTIGDAVRGNPADHRQVLDALKDIASAQTKIFNLIDSRLPERSKVDTPSPMRATGGLPAPSADLIKLKLDTNEVKVTKPVKPEDADLKPTG